MWFTGIDWADDHHDICVLQESGLKQLEKRIPHTVQGVASLIKQLVQITGPDHIQEMICVIETPHGLFVTALLQAGFAVYPVNPKTVDRWRKPSGAKTDQIDAFVLAKIARSDWRELPRLVPESPLLVELKALERDQQQLIRQQTRLSNQLRACLKSYYPAALHLFSALAQKSTLAFLLHFDRPETARAATSQEIAAVLKSAGHSQSCTAAQEIWEVLQKPTLLADPALVRAKVLLLRTLALQLQVVVAQAADYDREMKRVLNQHEEADLFHSLPGMGVHIAPRMLAECGDNAERKTDAVLLQRLAGCAPVCKQSGKSRQVSQRHSCIKPLRDAVYLWCLQTIKLVPWAKAYYHEKRAQGKSCAAALRALGCIWIRILCAMRKTHTCYSSEMFETARSRHQKSAA